MKWFGKSDEAQPEDADLRDLERSVQEAHLPDHVRQAALREIERLEKTHPSTAEYTIGLNYLDFVITMPWSSRSDDNLDMDRAEAILDEAHFGLDRIKERILEYLAVRSLKATQKMRILVADDEEIARQNLSHVLSREGYGV